MVPTKTTPKRTSKFPNSADDPDPVDAFEIKIPEEDPLQPLFNKDGKGNAVLIEIGANHVRRKRNPCKLVRPHVDGHALRTTRRRVRITKGTIHDFGRSCITNWLEAGVPPHEVQKMAGHASIETTIKYYAKADRTALDRVRRATEMVMARVMKGA